MIKLTLYPKTTRYSESEKGYIITEKLDGSNLGIGRIGEQVYICQRNYVIPLEEVQHGSNVVYKGLTEFCREYEEQLKELIYDGSIIFGEWLATGKLKYLHLDKFNSNRFYIFAKGRINLKNNNLELSNLVYDPSLLHYAFTNQEIPDFISTVPIVDTEINSVSTEVLDNLYEVYCNEEQRQVEGFIILDKSSNTIRKYVRYNREGKLVPYKETGGK